MTLDSLTQFLPQFLREQRISWIHPSYRDLVIDELSRDEALRLKFLRLMGLEGIKLAVSQAGGVKGERQMPFMRSEKSWHVLRDRAIYLASTLKNSNLMFLLDVLKSAVVDLSKEDREKLVSVLTAVCDTARQRWDRQKAVLKPEQLREFYEATILIDPLPVLPALGPTWKASESSLRSSLSEASSGSELVNAEGVLEWAQLSELLSNNEPRFLKQIGFPTLFKGLVVELVTIIDREAHLAPPSEDPDEIFHEAERMDQLSDALTVLTRLFPSESSRIKPVQMEVDRQEDFLRDLHHQEEPEGEDYEPDTRLSDKQEPLFDYESIFSDL